MPENRSRAAGVIWRLLRWKPKNLIEVWFSATVYGLTFLVIYALYGLLLEGLIAAPISTAMFGAGQTYQLHRRQDARGYVNLTWPHCDGDIWPRLSRSGWRRLLAAPS